MKSEQIRIRQIELNDHRPNAAATNRTAVRSGADANVDSRIVSFLVIITGLLAYGCYLAWESWRKLLHLIADPTSAGVSMVAVTIPVVVPLVTAFSYAVIDLSQRRDAPVFLLAGGLCLLGLVTAAIEMFVHLIG